MSVVRICNEREGILINHDAIAGIGTVYRPPVADNKEHIQTSELVDIIFGYGYYLLINKSARMTN